MKASRPADEDRLPWLEPYRETIAQKQRVARRSHGRLVAYAGSLILLIAAAGGGYWLGQRDEAPGAPKSAETIALPAPKPQPVQVAEAPPAELAANVQDAEAEPAEAAKPTATRKNTPARKRSRPRKIRSAGLETAQLNAIRESQEQKAEEAAPSVQQPPLPPPPSPRPQASSRPAARVWPKMPSPGPAGQVIQLGAFTSINRASSAYHSRVARYPLLAQMPRVIVPVATKPGNRVLYVLRLGTTSRQQSHNVCRNLRRSGDHCLVIG